MSVNWFFLGALVVCLIIILPLLLAVIWSQPALNTDLNLNGKVVLTAVPAPESEPLLEGTVVQRKGDVVSAVRMETKPAVLSLTLGQTRILKAVIDMDLYYAVINATGHVQVHQARFSHNGFLSHAEANLPDAAWNLKDLFVVAKSHVVIVVNERDLVVLSIDGLQTLYRLDIPHGKVAGGVTSETHLVLWTLDERHQQNWILRLDLGVPDKTPPRFEVFPVAMQMTRLLATKATRVLCMHTTAVFSWYDLVSEERAFFTETGQFACVTQKDDLILVQDGQVRLATVTGSSDQLTDLGRSIKWLRSARGLYLGANEKEYVVYCESQLDFCQTTQLKTEDKPGTALSEQQQPKSSILYFPSQIACQEEQPLAVGPLPENKVACVFSNGAIEVLGLVNGFHLETNAAFLGFSRGRGHQNRDKNKKGWVGVQNAGQFGQSGYVHEKGERLVRDKDKLYWTFSEGKQPLAIATSSSLLDLHV